jgi:excisionase family DNA binding protein
MTKQQHLLLTVREVSALLRIHRPKVYELIKGGVIDGFKLGSDWRVRRESLEKLTGPIPEGFFVGLGPETDDSSSQFG